MTSALDPVEDGAAQALEAAVRSRPKIPAPATAAARLTSSRRDILRWFILSPPCGVDAQTQACLSPYRFGAAPPRCYPR